MLFSSRLVIHDGKKGEHKEGSTDGREVDRGEIGSDRGALVGCAGVVAAARASRVVGWCLVVGRDECCSLCMGVFLVTLSLNDVQMMTVGYF